MNDQDRIDFLEAELHNAKGSLSALEKDVRKFAQLFSEFQYVTVSSGVQRCVVCGQNPRLGCHDWCPGAYLKRIIEATMEGE